MFLAIAKAMEEMVEDPIECYWLVSCFVNQLNSKHKDSLQQLVRKKYFFFFCEESYKGERRKSRKALIYGDNWSVRGDTLGFCSTNCSEKMGRVFFAL